jgi:Domain of unknown function (DUF6378)
MLDRADRPAMTTEPLLEQAASVVARRRRQYGQPIDLFGRVAARWSQVLGTTVTPAQVVICLLDLKVARLAHDPTYCDSLVDVIGYSVLLHELVRDASAEGPAAYAELAEQKGCTGIAAAEVPLGSPRTRGNAG